MARRSKQLSLIPEQTQSRLKAFGGELNEGKRKVARPISVKRPMHLVIKSSKAVGHLSFLNHQRQLDQTLRVTSGKWGVAIRKTAWVRNHVHLVLQFGSRLQYQGWIRELTAALVRTISNRLKAMNELESLILLKSFFDHRPFTRVIEWGRDYQQAIFYLTLNQMEVFGLRPFQKRKSSPKRPARPYSSSRKSSVLQGAIGSSVSF